LSASRRRSGATTLLAHGLWVGRPVEPKRVEPRETHLVVAVLAGVQVVLLEIG
jgi:hypothetical protein